jgi:hypothetical protein
MFGDLERYPSVPMLASNIHDSGGFVANRWAVIHHPDLQRAWTNCGCVHDHLRRQQGVR